MKAKLSNKNIDLKEMNVTVINKTYDAIKDLAKNLGLSDGEVVDRLFLDYNTNDPVKAAQIVLDNLAICTYKMDNHKFELTALVMLTVIKKTLNNGGINALRKTIDALETYFDENNVALDSRLSDLK